MPICQIVCNGIRLHRVERDIAIDNYLFCVAIGVQHNLVVFFAGEPGVGHNDASLRAKYSKRVVDADFATGRESRDATVWEFEARNSPLIDSADRPDMRYSGDSDRFCPCDKSRHRSGVATYIHDSAARRRVGEPNIGELRTEIVAEIRLYQANVPNRLLLNELLKFRCLRVTPIHKRLHQEDIVVLDSLENCVGFAIIDGERLLAQNVFLTDGAFDRPLCVQVIWQGDVDRIDFRVVHQSLIICVVSSHLIGGSKLVRSLLRPTPDRD